MPIHARLLFYCVPVCLAFSAFAQPRGLGIKTIENPKETVGAVAGIVVRDGTDEALGRVEVRVLRSGTRQAVATRFTDRNGRFRFNMRPGKYRLRFFLLGYDILEVEVTNTGTGKPEMRVDLPMGS